MSENQVANYSLPAREFSLDQNTKANNGYLHETVTKVAFFYFYTKVNRWIC
jgi:hypothetical protein